MVEGSHRENHRQPIDHEKQTCLRIQTIGMSVCLSVFPAAILAEMYGLQRMIAQMSLLLMLVGIILVAIGRDKWEKVAERRRTEKQKPM